MHPTRNRDKRSQSTCRGHGRMRACHRCEQMLDLGDSTAPGELSSQSSVGGEVTSVIASLVTASSTRSSSDAVGSSGEDSGFSTDVSDRQRECRKRLRARSSRHLIA